MSRFWHDTTKGASSWSGYAAAELLVNLSFEDALAGARPRVGARHRPAHARLERAAHTMAQLAADVRSDHLRQGVFLSEYQSGPAPDVRDRPLPGNKKLTEIRKVVADRRTEVEQRTTERDRNARELQELTTATTPSRQAQAIEKDCSRSSSGSAKALDRRTS